MYLKQLIVILLIALSFNAFAVRKQNITSNLTKAFSNINISISKSERRIAANFKNLYKLVNNGIINHKLVSKLRKDMKKSRTFKPYSLWPKNIIALSRLKKLKDIKPFCNQQTKVKHTDLIKKELTNNIIKLCFNKYLNQLSRNGHKTIHFHKKEAAFLGLNTDFLMNSFNLAEFKFLFSRFRRSSSKHKIYSRVISEFYQNSKSVPSKELLKYIYISPKFTRYLQTQDLDTRNTQYVFYKEFKKLKKKTFNMIDTKSPKNNEEIIASFNQSLNYFNLTYSHLPKEKSLASLLSLSKSLMRRGYHKLANKGFKRIIEQRKYHFDATIFEFVWSKIQQKEYDTVLKIVKDYKLTDQYLSENSKIKFWIGFIHEKKGNDDKAKKIFKSIIDENPLSYYAILSAKRLGESSQKSPNSVYLAAITSPMQSRRIASRNINKQWLERVVLWGSVGQRRFLSLELKNIQNIKEGIELENHILSAAYHLSLEKQYLESFKVIYKSINSGDLKLTQNTLKILFPNPYLKQIKRNTHSFDPIIALSLIRQESGFNTRAQSHVGARGLMQLMPNTAKQFKRRIKKKHLYNPSLNIKIGTKYFNNLLSRYKNNLVYSLAAYNAGERRVNEWQEDYMNSGSILENIENIPFLETRKYVKLIFRNIFFYKMILSKNEKDSKKFNKIYDIHLGFDS